MKKKLLLTGILFTCLIFTACGSSVSESEKYSADYAAAAASEEAVSGFYSDYEYSAENEPANAGSDTQSETFNDSARKLIKTYNMTIETEEFDNLLNAINGQINHFAGYIQNMDTNNGSLYSTYRYTKSSNMTIRIPKANLEAFVDFVGNNSNITYKNLSVEDVTLSYVDVESRKASYEIEQTRLLELLEKAESMQDILTIEERLSEVRYLLESMESQLRTYDNLVDYATVNLTINEVEKYTAPEPESYGERIVRSFTNSVSNVWEGLKNFLVGFVGAVPVLFVWGIVIAIVVLIVKAVNKKRRKKASKVEAKRADEMSAKAMENAVAKAEENKAEDNN